MSNIEKKFELEKEDEDYRKLIEIAKFTIENEKNVLQNLKEQTNILKQKWLQISEEDKKLLHKKRILLTEKEKRKLIYLLKLRYPNCLCAFCRKKIDWGVNHITINTVSYFKEPFGNGLRQKNHNAFKICLDCVNKMKVNNND